MIRGVFACKVICPKFGADKLVTGSPKTVLLNGFEISVLNCSFTSSTMQVSFKMAKDSDKLAGPRKLLKQREVLPNLKAGGAANATGLIQRSRPGSKRPEATGARCGTPSTALGRSTPLKMGNVSITASDCGRPLAYR